MSDFRFPFGLAACLAVTAAFTGCAMPNSSTPTLSITQARVTNARANLDMQIENPSDMDILVNAASWSLQYGPLPVADGQWSLGVEIPSKGVHQFSRQVDFTSPPLDPGASTLELSGVLHLETIGNTSDMALGDTAFSATSSAR